MIGADLVLQDILYCFSQTVIFPSCNTQRLIFISTTCGTGIFLLLHSSFCLAVPLHVSFGDDNDTPCDSDCQIVLTLPGTLNASPESNAGVWWSCKRPLMNDYHATYVGTEQARPAVTHAHTPRKGMPLNTAHIPEEGERSLRKGLCVQRDSSLSHPRLIT